VHGRAGGEHHRPLASRLTPERARLVGRIDLLELRHPDDLDEASGGDGLDAPLGLAGPA
jgi:hypothetical protein